MMMSRRREALPAVVTIAWLWLLCSMVSSFSPVYVPAKRTARLSSVGALLAKEKKEELSEEEKDVKMQKAMKAMTAFTNKYLQNTDTKLCQDKAVAAVVVKGLAEHKVQLGTPLCPCRFYEDKEAEAKDGYWNCPCVPMRERHECHCMLFLTEDNPFASEEQVSTII